MEKLLSKMCHSKARGFESAPGTLNLLRAFLFKLIEWPTAAWRAGLRRSGIEILRVRRGHLRAKFVEPLLAGENLAADAQMLEADALAVARKHSLAAPAPDAVGRRPTGATLGGFGDGDEVCFVHRGLLVWLWVAMHGF